MIVEADVHLSLMEKVILASIINKKYKHKAVKRIEKITDLTPDFLLGFSTSVAQSVSLKRTEENYKIVFNWCFKFLKRRLAESLSIQHRKTLCKRELEEYFYNHYFRVIAEQKGLSLNKFCKPNFDSFHINIIN